MFALAITVDDSILAYMSVWRRDVLSTFNSTIMAFAMEYKCSSHEKKIALRWYLTFTVMKLSQVVKWHICSLAYQNKIENFLIHRPV